MCLYICQWRIQHRAYPAYAPPLIGENIAFSCIFFNKVKLTIFFQPKCGLRPLLLHILDPPLYVATIPKGGRLVPAWKVRDHRFVPCFGIPSFKEQNVSSLLNRKWPQTNRAQFQIMCLEGSVTSFISPSPGGSSGPV